MTSKPATIPQPAITPYLTIKGASDAIEFYKKVFGAEETMRLTEPSGRLGHAEISINGSSIMLSDEYPEIDALGPQSRGGSTVGLHLYVADVDDVLARAVSEGATLIRPAKDEFYGDRSGKIADPFGHIWYVSTRKEEVSSDEVTKRYDELVKQQST